MVVDFSAVMVVDFLASGLELVNISEIWFRRELALSVILIGMKIYSQTDLLVLHAMPSI